MTDDMSSRSKRWFSAGTYGPKSLARHQPPSIELSVPLLPDPRVPDTELRERLRNLAEARRHFGYRRLFMLLRRDGERSGKNRIYRLYREEGLVHKRNSRRRAVGTRAPILVSPAQRSLVARFCA